MSRVECIPPSQSLRRTVVYNSSKLPHHSNLEVVFLLHIFLLSFAPHTKNHATYILQINNMIVTEKLNFSIWTKKIS
jgi:hypothetical protein